jgi:hypothetical protein
MEKTEQHGLSTNPDYFLGPWVDIHAEIPSYLTSANIGKVRVKKLDGTIVTYSGTNASAMVGFWMVENVANRNAFTDRSYMAPVGQAQITQYADKGFKLTQTKGW